MKKQAYGVTLQTRKQYRSIFLLILKKIRSKVSAMVPIEHVGGTSLQQPSGKGDLDVYIGYKSTTERKIIERQLEGIFGKPAKRTIDRTRFNFFLDGIEIEMQLSDMSRLRAAVALRDYLNNSPSEAKKYAQTVAGLRKNFLAKMFTVKSTFTKKAIRKRVG